jgi:uridine phosphorylase
MVSTQADLNTIRKQAALVKARRPLLMSSLYSADSPDAAMSVSGPMMGAPYAVAVMETLIAWGARSLLFFGWCGAISPAVGIGDIIVPTGSIIDEGTSLHYGSDTGRTSAASREAVKQIEDILTDRGLPFHKGIVWSTDAPFRETPEKVTAARHQGAVAVEMETSALFTAGRFQQVSVGAVLVVSDDLSSLAWKPGFKDKRFRNSRRAVCECLAGLCRI